MRKRVLVDDALAIMVADAFLSGEEAPFIALLAKDIEAAGPFYQQLIGDPAEQIFAQVAPLDKEMATYLRGCFTTGVMMVIAAVWFARQQWFASTRLPVLSAMAVDAYLGPEDLHVPENGTCALCHARANMGREWLRATTAQPDANGESPLSTAIERLLTDLPEPWMFQFVGDGIYETTDFFAHALEMDPRVESEPDGMPPEGNA